MVTGATGFVGQNLCPLLIDRGRDVWGVSRGCPDGERTRGRDLLESGTAQEVLEWARPEALVHLAGESYLPNAFADPAASFRTNVNGTWNLLEAASALLPEMRILLVSSGVVYGDPKEGELPLRETSPVRPIHPYALQKFAIEEMAGRFAAQGLDIVVARPFNHVGPFMLDRISLAHFSRQIASAELAGETAVLRVGNLEPRRDFLDVRDVVDAYLRLLDHPDPPRLVNVCSGVAVRIGDALDHLARSARVGVRIVPDPERYRALDTPELRGDATLLEETTGWSRQIPWNQTLRDILEQARRRVRGSRR